MPGMRTAPARAPRPGSVNACALTMSHDLRSRPLWRIRCLLLFMSALLPLGGGCSLRDATPPNPSQGSLVGPPALKLLFPDSWVDTTAPRSSISIIASAETGRVTPSLFRSPRPRGCALTMSPWTCGSAKAWRSSRS